MKNLLMTVFTLLIIILIALVMVNGIKIGKLEILSISSIVQRNDDLTKMIDDANNLNNVTYRSTLDSLQTATKQLAAAKSSYLNIASVSTEEEIKEANQESSYAREYLWSRIGNHATSKGVNIKIVATTSGVGDKNNLSFTVTGSYIGIRNFVYALENDSKLNFKIEGFKLSLGNSDESLVGEFTVKDIGIKPEQTTEQPTTSSSTSNTSETTTSDINTNTTTDNQQSVNTNTTENNQ